MSKEEIIEKMDKDLRFLEDNFINDDMTSIRVDIQLIKDFRKLLDLRKQLKEEFISKDKISEKIKALEKLYEKEMKPYQTEFGLNLSLLTKKEKEEVINKRNSLLIEIETLKELLNKE